MWFCDVVSFCFCFRSLLLAFVMVERQKEGIVSPWREGEDACEEKGIREVRTE